MGKDQTQGEGKKSSRASQPDSLKKEEIPLTEEDKVFLKDYANIDSDDQKLKILVEYLTSKDKVVNGICFIIECELRTNKLGILREESMGANLLKVFWFHYEGKEYMKKIIKPLVKDAISATKSKTLEFDLNKVDEKTAEKNLNKVLDILRKWKDSFLASYDRIPSNFRKIMIYLYNLLTEVEGIRKSHLGLGYSEKALQMFGGFFLLRFICPAIVSPGKFGIIKENPSINTQKTLVSMSKLLQAAANQIDLDGAPKNARNFVEETTPQIMAFLNTFLNEELEKEGEKSNRKGSLSKTKKVDDPEVASDALQRAGFL